MEKTVEIQVQMPSDDIVPQKPSKKQKQTALRYSAQNQDNEIDTRSRRYTDNQEYNKQIIDERSFIKSYVDEHKLEKLMELIQKGIRFTLKTATSFNLIKVESNTLQTQINS